MEYETITEGSTKLLVPSSEIPTKKDEVFYNPHMELARDISIAFIKTVEPGDFLDLLAASGARGLRVANETGVDVTLNDANPKAASLIKKNAKLNNLTVNVENKNHRILLSDKRFDYIDIDPFGPPAPYMDDVFSSVTGCGYIGVAATDTSALSGTYPKACMRKYGAISLRTDYYDELGVRILLAYLGLTGLRHGLGAEFQLSHASRHYFRTYIKVGWKNKMKNKTLDNIGYIQHCFKCLMRKYENLNGLKENCECRAKLQTAGPVWTGPTADPEICRKIGAELAQGEYGSKKQAVKIVEKIKAEQAINLPYYNIHKLFKNGKIKSMKNAEIFEKIQQAGYNACPTHFNDVGVKTDAWPIIEIISK